MPVEGLPITVADGNPFKERVEGLCDLWNGRKPMTDDGEEIFTPIRIFRVVRRNVIVYVLRSTRDGRITKVVQPWDDHSRRLDLFTRSFQAVNTVYDMTAEVTAIMALAQHVSDHQYKSYLLIGALSERSTRSGVMYIFRKARPTLAFKPFGPEGELRPLAALCMHPVGYYDKSFIGSMTPTDDVIAHLLMMRGDERMYWRRSNQHPFDSISAGI